MLDRAQEGRVFDDGDDDEDDDADCSRFSGLDGDLVRPSGDEVFICIGLELIGDSRPFMKFMLVGTVRFSRPNKNIVFVVLVRVFI